MTISINKKNSSKINDNPFFNFVKNYFYFLREVKFNYDSPGNRTVVSKWIWSKEKKYLVPNYLEKELKTLQFDRYNRVGEKQILNINYDIDQWLNMVKQFIIFLDIAELSSLFKNEKGECSLYIDCDSHNSSYIMYYYDDSKETEYRISFMETSIPKPGSQSSIVSFINATDEEDEDSTITLIQIDILRRYGDKRTNQIKLIENSTDCKSLLAKSEEALIFNVFRDILSQVIFNTFSDILNNVNKAVGFERNITEEVLNGYIKFTE